MTETQLRPFALIAPCPLSSCRLDRNNGIDLARDNLSALDKMLAPSVR